MEFKKLELEDEKGSGAGVLKSPQLRKTLIAMLIGAAIGFIYFYLSEGRNYEVLELGDILKSSGIGAFFGFFITNSPCARGRC